MGFRYVRTSTLICIAGNLVVLSEFLSRLFSAWYIASMLVRVFSVLTVASFIEKNVNVSPSPALLVSVLSNQGQMLFMPIAAVSREAFMESSSSWGTPAPHPPKTPSPEGVSA